MIDGLEIRGARREELAQVFEIAQTVSPIQQAPNLKEIHAFPKNPEQDWHVAVLPSDQLVAVAHTEMVDIKNKRTEKEILAVHRLAVAPEYRGRGIGKQLLEHIVGFGQERLVSELEVRLVQTDPRVEEFLRSAGFTAIRPDLFKLPIAEDPRDAEIPYISFRPDLRVPDEWRRKKKFLGDAYPDTEFSDAEVANIFEHLPHILDLYRQAFHPKIRKRLDDYTAVLIRYADTNVSTRQLLDSLPLYSTPFNSANSLLVWLKGFSGAVASALDADELKTITALMVDLESQSD